MCADILMHSECNRCATGARLEITAVCPLPVKRRVFRPVSDFSAEIYEYETNNRFEICSRVDKNRFLSVTVKKMTSLNFQAEGK